MFKKNVSILIFSMLILSVLVNSYEFELKINDSINIKDKTVTVVNIGMGGIIVDVDNEEKTINIDDSEGFDDVFIIPKELFYVKEKDERFVVIDFCEKKEEACNNVDDDCDGKVDENLKRKCGVAKGICKQGTQTCKEGEWGYCIDAVYAQEEICNDLDDDCDGEIDENLERECGNSPLIGLCRNGMQECIEGNWTECKGLIYPKPEDCNGIDDDCDGEIDEDLKKKCGESGVGACTMSFAECKKGKWQDCDSVLPTDEICDGIDNNCNGEIDEELFESCGITDEGECMFGQKRCIKGKWTKCLGSIEPLEELCDKKDNDCNGIIDDNCKEQGIFSRIFGFFTNIFS